MAIDPRSNLPVLVVAPFGRDGNLISETLQRAKISCELHHDPRVVFPRLCNGTGALLVEEEALNEELIKEFAVALQNQPAWSDAPVIMLTKARNSMSRGSRMMARDAAAAGSHDTAGAADTAGDPGEHGRDRFARAPPAIRDSRCARALAGQRGALSLTHPGGFFHRVERRPARQCRRNSAFVGGLHRSNPAAVSRAGLDRMPFIRPTVARRFQ